MSLVQKKRFSLQVNYEFESSTHLTRRRLEWHRLKTFLKSGKEVQNSGNGPQNEKEF